MHTFFFSVLFYDITNNCKIYIYFTSIACSFENDIFMYKWLGITFFLVFFVITSIPTHTNPVRLCNGENMDITFYKLHYFISEIISSFPPGRKFKIYTDIPINILRERSSIS